MSTKLNPTQVTEATVGDIAFDGVRRRPVVAIDDEGQLVVCCRRTAAKHGWKVEGTLHQRTRSSKVVEPVAAAKGKKALKLNIMGSGPVLSVEDLLGK